MSKSSDSRDQANLSSIYGALFFGVPGQGMDVTSLAAMVEGLPSRFTLSILDEKIGHQLRNRQYREFCEAFAFPDSKIIQFYETKRSPTAQQVPGSDKWSRDGPKALLVNPSSAFCGRPWETGSDYRIPLHRDHSEIVKFAENDHDYDKVQSVLSDFVINADAVIQQRFESTNTMTSMRPMQLAALDAAGAAIRVTPQDYTEIVQVFRLAENDDAYESYKDRVEDRVDGTCEWFLSHHNFNEWLQQSSGPLLVSADPGCGKSVLAKYLIDYELPRSAASRSTTICYFFFKDQLQNTLRQALCAILHQLFSKKPSLIRHAQALYLQNRSKLVELPHSLWDILEMAIRDPQAGAFTIILDALDECTESDFRDLVAMLKRLFSTTSGSRIKFLLTCRPYEEIVSEFRDLISIFPYIRIPGEEQSEQIGQEVNAVIKFRVQKLGREKALKREIQDYLQTRLLDIPHRTYLWVYLVFDYLKSQNLKKTKKSIESHLTTLPESVNQAYEAMLRRSQDPNLLRKTLSCILAAKRPLTLKEMNIAINIEDTESTEDLDLEADEDFRDSLRASCGLFVSIHNDRVHFIHQTAREFLVRESLYSASDLERLHWRGSINLKQANAVLAKVCLQYLNLSDFDNADALRQLGLNNSEFPDLLGVSDGGLYAKRERAEVSQSTATLVEAVAKAFERYALLDYSALYWTTHFREGKEEIQPEITHFALKNCRLSPNKSEFWSIIGDVGIALRHDYFYTHRDSSSLITASVYGLDAVVESLIAEEGLIPEIGHIALHPAASNGHNDVVKRLQDQGADIIVNGGNEVPIVKLVVTYLMPMM